MNERFTVPDDIYDNLPDGPEQAHGFPPAKAHSQYPPSLPHDVALCCDDDELETVLAQHHITPVEYDYIRDLPNFKREVTEWNQKIHSEGYGFKLKLRSIAEAYIPTLVRLLHDDSVAPSVKTDLFKYITRTAGLEPTKDALQGETNNSITIQINTFTPDATPLVVSATPIPPATPRQLT